MPNNLLSVFPIAKDLLAVEPEELGGVILELVPSIAADGKFQHHILLEPLFRPSGPSYERGLRRQVELAVAEAITWLVSHGLAVVDPDQPATWYVLTRRAKRLRTRTDIDAFRRGRALPVDLLQPALSEKVWPLFLRGDHDVAVFQAFKVIEVAVRNAANTKGAAYADDLVGKSLMREAFHPNKGPLTDKTRASAEREAEAALFAGAIGHAKNPTSHRDVNLAPQEAARLIVFASHLLSIVEQRTS